MNIKTIPRELINLNIRAARLPLSLLERATGRDAELGSPISIALDTAEATVKETLGGLLNDEHLLSDARLTRAKLAKLEQAAEQAAAAERREVVAEERLDAQLSSAQERQRQVEQDARLRKQQLAQEKAQAKQRVAAEAAQQKQAAAKAAAARQAQIDADKRVLDLKRLDAEAQALADKERAIAADERVTQLDAAAKATKRARTRK